MGFLDKAKKLAGQAKVRADQAKDMAQQALDDARSRPVTSGSAGPTSATTTDPQMGTAYVPGMLGRPGWRERGLADPAAVLPIRERDRAGVPHSVKSRIVEEPFGMGRRWSGDRGSAALFYQLYPEHRAWEPPGGKVPFAEVSGASAATLDDGRSLVFVARYDHAVVLEVTGLAESARTDLARAVVDNLLPDSD